MDGEDTTEYNVDLMRVWLVLQDRRGKQSERRSNLQYPWADFLAIQQPSQKHTQTSLGTLSPNSLPQPYLLPSPTLQQQTHPLPGLVAELLH